MAVYRTRDGDILDAICLAYYGQVQSTLESVLAANPGLAELGSRYSAGLFIQLPDLPVPLQNPASIRLWS